MRPLMALILAIGLPAMAGCASHLDSRPVGFSPELDTRPVEVASALLFDARPGLYDPQWFAARSDWPSTPAFYSPGQVIYFNERMVDYQGRSFSHSWGTYRRAESVRVGMGYRP